MGDPDRRPAEPTTAVAAVADGASLSAVAQQRLAGRLGMIDMELSVKRRASIPCGRRPIGTFRPGPVGGRCANQHLRGDVHRGVELPDHRQRQRSVACQHLRDACMRPDERLEILARPPDLLAASPDGSDRIERQDRKVLALVRVDQGCERVELLLIR
jgi:hypothetical protein